MSGLRRIDRPQGKEAYMFELGDCADPTCGAHILAMDRQGHCFAEIVVGVDGLPSLIAALQRLYAEKLRGKRFNGD